MSDPEFPSKPVPVYDYAAAPSAREVRRTRRRRIQKVCRITARVCFVLALCLLLIGWGLGSYTALHADLGANTCTTPYTWWAYTWPLMEWAPHDWSYRFITWTIHQCP